MSLFDALHESLEYAAALNVAVVIVKRVLIQVRLKVLSRDGVVGTADATLDSGPEALDRVV